MDAPGGRRGSAEGIRPGSMGSSVRPGPQNSFSTVKKMTEVRGVYGGPARPYPARLPALPTASSSQIGDDGASSVAASVAGGSRIRYTYLEGEHPSTAASGGRAQALANAAAAERERREKDAKDAKMRNKKTAAVSSQYMAPHVHEFGGNKEAKALMLEIERWSRKLRNCHLELDFRQREFLHVSAGGDPFDDEVESQAEFDSDTERDYTFVASLPQPGPHADAAVALAADHPLPPPAPPLLDGEQPPARGRLPGDAPRRISHGGESAVAAAVADVARRVSLVESACSSHRDLVEEARRAARLSQGGYEDEYDAEDDACAEDDAFAEDAQYNDYEDDQDGDPQ
eukprot:Hpha_TRINITY_DN27970_c0_g1::TRINITY_DN27970_c0_g1_i1::g.45026::m.45026